MGERNKPGDTGWSVPNAKRTAKMTNLTLTEDTRGALDALVELWGVKSKSEAVTLLVKHAPKRRPK